MDKQLLLREKAAASSGLRDWGEDCSWDGLMVCTTRRRAVVILSYVECTATGSSGLRGTGCNKQRAGRKGEGAVNMNHMKYLDLYNPSIGKGAS